MKRKSFMGAVVLGALLVVFAGISQAGGGVYESKDTLEYWGPVEAGTLPSSDVSSRLSKTEAAPPGSKFTDVLEHWGPVEAGTVPSSDVSSRLSKTEDAPPGSKFTDVLEHWGPAE